VKSDLDPSTNSQPRIHWYNSIARSPGFKIRRSVGAPIVNEGDLVPPTLSCATTSLDVAAPLSMCFLQTFHEATRHRQSDRYRAHDEEKREETLQDSH
jgi:hypothetical protein